MGPRGISPLHVAALVAGRAPPGPKPFQSNGRDLLPILRQVVSGELDADRMDYLQRDSFFTGVNYGKFDDDWIIQNLTAIEQDGSVHLGLLPRAVFAFEDFLLSRYHMFMSVYFHYASVGYEQLLQRYCETSSGEYSLPSDIDEYLQHDDVALLSALRKSENPWARRVVRRQGFKMLLEEGPFEAARSGIDAQHVAAMAGAPRRRGHRLLRHHFARRPLALRPRRHAPRQEPAREYSDRRIYSALQALRRALDARPSVRGAGSARMKR